MTTITSIKIDDDSRSFSAMTQGNCSVVGFDQHPLTPNNIVCLVDEIEKQLNVRVISLTLNQDPLWLILIHKPKQNYNPVREGIF